MSNEITRYNNYLKNQSIKPAFATNRELTKKIKRHEVASSLTEKYLCLVMTAPFVKQWCYYDNHWVARHYQNRKIYPVGKNLDSAKNKVLVFSYQPFITSATLLELNFVLPEPLQYPLHIFDQNQTRQEKQINFLKTTQNKYARDNFNDDGISFFTYKEIKRMSRKKHSHSIFAYVYGFLYYKQYQEQYRPNLYNRQLPWIFKPKHYATFKAISSIGRTLMALHLNYETANLYNVSFEQGGWDLEPEKY